jgi:hypothetical protein
VAREFCVVAPTLRRGAPIDVGLKQKHFDISNKDKEKWVIGEFIHQRWHFFVGRVGWMGTHKKAFRPTFRNLDPDSNVTEESVVSLLRDVPRVTKSWKSQHPLELMLWCSFILGCSISLISVWVLLMSDRCLMFDRKAKGEMPCYSS